MSIPGLTGVHVSHTTAGQVRLYFDSPVDLIPGPARDMGPDTAEVLAEHLRTQAQNARDAVRKVEQQRAEAHQAHIREVMGHIPPDVPPEHAHAAAEALLAAFVLKPREAT